ncbi:hypothetical protein TRV_02988, partial [Trichophyton verrucosum HKI 0517]
RPGLPRAVPPPRCVFQIRRRLYEDFASARWKTYEPERKRKKKKATKKKRKKGEQKSKEEERRREEEMRKKRWTLKKGKVREEGKTAWDEVLRLADYMGRVLSARRNLRFSHSSLL